MEPLKSNPHKNGMINPCSPFLFELSNNKKIYGWDMKPSMKISISILKISKTRFRKNIKTHQPIFFEDIISLKQD